MDWEEIRQIIIKGLFKSFQILEEFIIVKVPSLVLSKVADVTATAVKMGAKVDWMDKILSEIARKKELLIFSTNRRAYKRNSDNWFMREKK